MTIPLMRKTWIVTMLLSVAFYSVAAVGQEGDTGGSVQHMTVDSLSVDSGVVVLDGVRYQLPEGKKDPAQQGNDAQTRFLPWDQWLKPGMEVEVIVDHESRPPSGLPRIVRIGVAK